nr:guanylate-binding protein 4-like [Tanacetum cinerariifolium]
DFYLDLVEDNRKITPRDYLELALRPVQGGGRDVSAKNEIRESIRGLFPDRDCFTLVRPLSNENELQRLDQISVDTLRPEFKAGLDALTRFVFERTKPKQVGATVMTGPIFAGITQSFLDALNNGAVPTITSAWQSVEETECQRALEYASEVYKSSFDSTKPPEEATIREAHEEAVQKALAAFNSMAVGAGSVRQRCEKRLHTFLRKELEDYKREAFLKAYMQCTNAIQKMEKELRTACQAPGAKFDDILKATIREAHEEAVQKALAAFNSMAVGAGSVRQRCEKRLHTFLRKELEDYQREAFLKAYMQCTNAIQKMEKELRTACQAPGAKFDDILKVLDQLLSSYEATSYGPEKWQKLASFLRQSLGGPVVDFVKKQIDNISAEKSSLRLKCRSIEDKMGLLTKQLEASEKYKSDYLRRYEDAINDKKKLAEEYMTRIADLKRNSSSLDERYSNLSKTLEAAKHESLDWKRKYEVALSKQKAVEEQASTEVANLKARSSAAEARLAAAREQTLSAQGEAGEWKRKYDVAVKEAKSALEKAAAVQDRASKQTQNREYALRAEFEGTLADKEAEIKDKARKIEQAEQRVTTLNMELKAAESKIKSYDIEISALKSEIKELGERLEGANAKAQSYEKEARILEQERVHLEQKYQSEFSRFAEVQERCRNAETETKRANEMADIARADAVAAQKEKNEIQRLASDRKTEISRLERRIESLDRQKNDLNNELEQVQAAEMDAVSKVAILEARVEEREKEIETLLKSNNEQRATTVHVLESLLETERAARAEATNRAEALSVQLQATQGKLDLLQQQMTTVRLNESALDSKLRTASHGKRVRVEDTDMGTDSVDGDRAVRGNKRSRSTTSPLQYVSTEDGGSFYRGDDQSNHSQDTTNEDYTKFTILKLKQELTKNNFGAELLQLKNPNKKELVALYERCIIQKS